MWGLRRRLPSGAINVHHFTFDQYISQIDALTNWEIQPLRFRLRILPRWRRDSLFWIDSLEF